MSTSSTPSAPARQQWADVAKGVCIALVVLWHVTRKDYLQLPWDLELPLEAAWGTLSEVLLPVRMPLFFLISGLFAARQLSRPWREVWTARVAPLLYLFVVWTLVHTLVLRLAPGFDTAVAHSPVDLLVQLTITPGNLWYLLALGLYVAVARATRAAPGWALGAALVLSAVAGAGLVATPGNRYGLLTNLVWFLLGTRVQAWRLPLGHRAGPRAVAAVVGGFVVAAAAWQLLGADRWFGVRPALGLLGIAAGASVAAWLAVVPRLGPAAAALGRQTLPVYVLHLPLVAVAHVGSARLVGRGDGIAGSLGIGALYPVVLTAAVLAACLLLHRLLERSGAWWLFTAPWQRPTVRHSATPAGPPPPGRARPLARP